MANRIVKSRKVRSGKCGIEMTEFDDGTRLACAGPVYPTKRGFDIQIQAFVHFNSNGDVISMSLASETEDEHGHRWNEVRARGRHYY